MKRTSAHLQRASSERPARGNGAKTVESEGLRFREQGVAAPSSTYSRLYAQGVDLMVHKDQVYQQFGLHKSPPSSSLHATKAKPTVEHATRASTTFSAYSSRQPTRTTSSAFSTSMDRKRSASAGYSRFSERVTSPRASQTATRPRASTTHPQNKTTRKPATPSRGASKPVRRQSTIATQLLNRTLKIGPATIHPASLQPSMSHRNGHSGSGSPPTPRKSIINAGFSHQMPPPAPLNRRMSFQVAVNRAVSSTVMSKSTQKLSNSGQSREFSPSKPTIDTSTPVLVPVSRRTSSPIIAPNAADFGMRKRPSVSPIRGGNGLATPSGDACGFSSSRPPLIRRDSKMDRLVEQITVLKNSLGLSDEDLQWKVESTKGNAYLAADKHLSEAEERYDRLTYEIQLLSETPCDEASAALVKRMKQLIQQSQVVSEMKPRLVGCQNDVTRLKKELMDARIATELRIAKTRGDMFNTVTDETTQIQEQVDEAKQRLLQTQEELKTEMSKLNELLVTLNSETDSLAKACDEFRFMSTEAADVSNAFVNILYCIPECSGDKLVSLCEQGMQTAQRLTGSRVKDVKRKEAEQAKALKDIEIWKVRKDQSKEYAVETAKQEKRWREDNMEANTASLWLLRGMIPHDIQQLTIDSIIERAQALGVLYTYDLAIYLKQNRFLHWLVTHETDIARDNFLAVECASWFLNFTNYDIQELRALCRILPESFDFDKEGKKSDWKMQFLEHVRVLVKQQNGEKIKAGWDPVKGTRAEVPLKALSDKQLVNSVYRYPTEDEIKARIDKFELQLERLAQKREKCESLERDIPTAKAEYLAIAEDARSDELQRLFGKTQLIQLRDTAKATLQSLTKSRDVLKSEIEHSVRLWNAQCPSYEQYLEEVKKVRALDPHTRATRIRGPFPEEIVLKPRERAAFKKLSVEEEAQARRQELSKAIADRDKEILDSAAAATEEEARRVSTAVVTNEEKKPEEGETTTNAAAASSVEAASTKEQPVAPTTKTEPEPDSTTAGTSFRRVKSLRVSVEVLKFLQNDFCSPRRNKSSNSLMPADAINAGEGNAPRRRPSFPKPNEKDPAQLTVATAPVAPAEPPRPKSKALLALLARKEESPGGESDTGTDDAAASRPAAKLNFLGELKKRANKTNESSDAAAASTTSSSVEGVPPRPKVNFLDELKLGAKKKQEQTEEAKLDTETETSVPPPPPIAITRPPMAMSPPKSFLDELKARAKSTLEE
ncbi:hypothetical protein Poli38472_010634 [Pythium oligandrum]|uniref:Uncharacterized protein n=1 Tax=Pythium oligandrum TaxID=41045 RepID=A0A8K1C422_PYTOL|nr:hypothetical protein Poli38472_010634 [Pythium oligandrum]|eukprot:TMW55752.1 hypothetical protein Poli38472_010634 [Pythium oligandrum]